MFDGDYITANGWPRQGGKGGVGGASQRGEWTSKGPGTTCPVYWPRFEYYAAVGLAQKRNVKGSTAAVCIGPS